MRTEGGFNFDDVLGRHVQDEEWDIREDELLEEVSALERGFEFGEELALEEQTFGGANWDED